MSYTDEQWQKWCQTFDDTEKEAPAQTVTNSHTFNVTYAVQYITIINQGGQRPLSITNVIETAMDATARKLASPMTAEDVKLLKEQSGYMVGYG